MWNQAVENPTIQKMVDEFSQLEEDGQQLGYAWIEVKQYAENAFRLAYRSIFVHQLSISNGQRNKGYGTAMMEYIEQFARDHEIDKLELDYWTANVSVMRFMRGTVFRCTGNSCIKILLLPCSFGEVNRTQRSKIPLQHHFLPLPLMMIRSQFLYTKHMAMIIPRSNTIDSA